MQARHRKDFSEILSFRWLYERLTFESWSSCPDRGVWMDMNRVPPFIEFEVAGRFARKVQPERMVLVASRLKKRIDWLTVGCWVL